MRRSLSLLVTCCLFSSHTFGWWALGHRVVARLAAAHLTSPARTRIARILEVNDSPEAVADALALASTWADETKAQTRTGEWHYIDLTLLDHKHDIPRRCRGGDCAPARIRLFADALRSHQVGSQWSELDQLRYLVHLTGDLHQPLHTASDADVGGNCEQLREPFGKAKNLHGLWDGGILEAMGLDDRSLAQSLQSSILAESAGEQENMMAGGVDDWTWQSHELAIEVIYRKLHIPIEPSIFPKSCSEAPLAIQEFKPEIDGLYVDSMKPVVREQLMKAGLRLAKLLNESL